MSSSQERAAQMSFVERHGLWSDEQFEAAARAERLIEENRLEIVRLSFADQHGILRGKTAMAADAARTMRNGCTVTTTLLAKDTSHRSVFPVFTAGGGFGMPEMEGGADVLMIADPTTFRVLPWAPRTGWVLCDLYFQDGRPVPFSTRASLSAGAAAACRCRLRLHGRARGRIPCFQAGQSAARSRRHHLAGRSAGSRDAGARLSISHRNPSRSDRADPGKRAAQRRCARPAAALGRDRARAEPVRVHVPTAGRASARRHDDAVSQRGEADLPPARLSRELHVPAETAERHVERLASASVTASTGVSGSQCVHGGKRTACFRRRDSTISRASWRMRARPRRSPRRPSTATSAIANMRWRPIGSSGATTIAA